MIAKVVISLDTLVVAITRLRHLDDVETSERAPLQKKVNLKGKGCILGSHRSKTYAIRGYKGYRYISPRIPVFPPVLPMDNCDYQMLVSCHVTSAHPVCAGELPRWESR